MRSPLRTLLALTLLSTSASASAAASATPTPAANSLDNDNNLSPFHPGLLLANDNDNSNPIHYLPAASHPTPTALHTPTTPLPSPTTTPAPAFWQHHDLFNRQASSSTSGGTTCPRSYSACANLGFPGLCCRSGTNCQADEAGHVACCPEGAVCTGTIDQGRTVGSGVVMTTVSPGVSSGTTTTGGTGGGGFIVVASSTVAVPNAAGRRAVPGWGWF